MSPRSVSRDFRAASLHPCPSRNLVLFVLFVFHIPPTNPSVTFRRAELSARHRERVVPSCPSCLKNRSPSAFPSAQRFSCFSCRIPLSEIVIIVCHPFCCCPVVPKTSRKLFPIVGKSPFCPRATRLAKSGFRSSLPHPLLFPLNKTPQDTAPPRRENGA